MGLDRRPTLQQVALHAGVSRSTAGAALAGSPRVAVTTLERVRDSAVALGYRTEPHARHLRQGGPESVSIVLDTRLTHGSDGAFHPFWSRVLTGFIAHMQTSGWLCTVQLHHPGVPLLPTPAPGVVLATGDHGQVSMFVHDTFGQRIISPVEGEPHDGLHLCLHHDFDAIGRACADYLSGAHCRSVLLLGRTGFAYSDSILTACRRHLATLGVQAQEVPPGQNAAVRLHDFLHDGIDGVLDLTAEPAALARGLHGHEIVASDPEPGQLVVVSNADGADPTTLPKMARLSLEGHAVGEMAADYFLSGIDGQAAAIPDLPFVIHPGQGAA